MSDEYLHPRISYLEKVGFIHPAPRPQSFQDSEVLGILGFPEAFPDLWSLYKTPRLTTGSLELNSPGSGPRGCT